MQAGSPHSASRPEEQAQEWGKCPQAGPGSSPLVTFCSKPLPAPAPADCHEAGPPTWAVLGTRMLGRCSNC